MAIVDDYIKSPITPKSLDGIKSRLLMFLEELARNNVIRREDFVIDIGTERNRVSITITPDIVVYE